MKNKETEQKTSLANLSRSIGECIASHREQKNLTQEKVAEILGIGTEAISRLERGITMPTIARLAELAEIYDCHLEELVTGGSTRVDDQAKHIASLMKNLQPSDREIILQIVRSLCLRFTKEEKE